MRIKLEAMLDQFSGSPGSKALPKAWFMTDPRYADPVEIVKRLPIGCGVIIRHYDDPGRVKLISSIKQAAKAKALPILIAGDDSLAADAQVAGVHWPAWAKPQAADEDIISVHAVHNEAELYRAAQYQADAVIISPIFPTRSHEGLHYLGIKGLEQLLNKTHLPAYVMGGITLERLAGLSHLNISGFAGISCFEELL